MKKYMIAKFCHFGFFASVIISFFIASKMNGDSFLPILVAGPILVPFSFMVMSIKCSKCGESYFYYYGDTFGVSKINLLVPLSKKCRNCGFDRFHNPDGPIIF